MELLITDAIKMIQAKKKRPSMEEIYNTIVRQNEGTTMDEFKNVFDECLSREVIKKRDERDSYFVEVNANEDSEVPVHDEVSVHATCDESKNKIHMEKRDSDGGRSGFNRNG